MGKTRASKKVLMVYPRSFSASIGDLRSVPYLTGPAGILNSTLPTIAALSPRDWEISIVDESCEPIDFSQRYDLVCLTAYSTQVRSAQRVARRFRERGTPVVCGGPSVSVSPERWRSFSDTLVIGEAEDLWPEFVTDFMAGAPRPEYRMQQRPDLGRSPVPDYSKILPRSRSACHAGLVQTSRGCPFECEFCAVIVYLGRKLRFKPIDTVIAEIEQLHRMGIHVVILADDNFSAARKRAKEVLRAVSDWNRRQRHPVAFSTQLSIDCAEDEELLELAAEAGLTRVMVGIESTNPESLAEINKAVNLRHDVAAAIKKFYEHGILVIGTTIVGLDHDDRGVFRQQLGFLNRAGIMNPQPFCIQAYDGTPLKERLVREGRYLEVEPDVPADRVNVLNTFTVVPKQMTQEQLRRGLFWLIHELYRPQAVLGRLRVFFDAYEASPKRKRLRALRRPVDGWALGILQRVLRYVALQASPDERRCFLQMLACARASSHPEKFSIAVTAFLVMKNAHEVMRELVPEFGTFRDPGLDAPEPASRALAEARGQTV